MLVNWTVDSSHDNNNVDALNSSYFDEMKITDPKLFKIDTVFEQPWYNTKSKYKLGKLYNARLRMHAKDKERECVCRLLDLERISAYTLESFENRMKNLLSIQGAEKFWLKPSAFFIDEKLRVSLFYPNAVSLYELLHSDPSSSNHFCKVL